jgi:multicomponent Na+:H+ antiporter subunit B
VSAIARRRGADTRGLILPTAVTYLMPLLLLFSVFLLLRGHNEPGGGFSGGLVAAAAFALLATASGVRTARRTLRADPRSLAAAGALVMIGSGLVGPLLAGRPFLSATWWEGDLPGLGAVYLGTPLAFDVGVYLAVAGTVLAIVFVLEEEPA